MSKEEKLWLLSKVLKYEFSVEWDKRLNGKDVGFEAAII